MQSQGLARQHNVRVPVTATQFTNTSHSPPPGVQVQNDSSYPSTENNAQKSLEVEHQPASHGMQVSQMPSSSASMVNQERERSSISVQGLNKQQQQQHLHFSQTSFPMYGSSGGNYHPYSATSVNSSGSSAKPQPHDLQMRQISHHQSMGPTQLGGPTQPVNVMSVTKFERQNSANDPNRGQSSSISHYPNKSALQQNPGPWQPPTNKEQSSTLFSSINYVKQESVEQPTEQQHKSQLSNPQKSPAAPVEQGNAVSGNLKDVSLEKPSSKVVFSTPTGMAPPNSVSPSIATQLDPNVQVISFCS